MVSKQSTFKNPYPIVYKRKGEILIIDAQMVFKKNKSIVVQHWWIGIRRIYVNRSIMSDVTPIKIKILYKIEDRFITIWLH
jgi:hypothetical protein